jgi:hypothetical protein
MEELFNGKRFNRVGRECAYAQRIRTSMDVLQSETGAENSLGEEGKGEDSATLVQTF